MNVAVHVKAKWPANRARSGQKGVGLKCLIPLFICCKLKAVAVAVGSAVRGRVRAKSSVSINEISHHKLPDETQSERVRFGRYIGQAGGGCSCCSYYRSDCCRRWLLTMHAHGPHKRPMLPELLAVSLSLPSTHFAAHKVQQNVKIKGKRKEAAEEGTAVAKREMFEHVTAYRMRTIQLQRHFRFLAGTLQATVVSCEKVSFLIACSKGVKWRKGNQQDLNHLRF